MNPRPDQIRRLKASTFNLSVIVFLFSKWAFPAIGQVLLPEDYSGQCRITHQEAVIVLHDGKECLALEARYEFIPTASPRPRMTRMPAPPSPPLDPPSQMAWVVPVLPGCSLLDSTEDALFEDLYEWLHPSIKAIYGLRTGRPKGINRFQQSVFAAGASSGIRQAEWNIVAGTGEAAVQALVNWGESNHFRGVDANLAKDYASRGWTFAIGVVKDPDQAGKIGPAHFNYASQQALFPLKFQANTGAFDFNIYLFTAIDANTRPVSYFRLGAVRGLSSLSREGSRGYVTVAAVNPPESVTAHLRRIQSLVIPDLPKDTLRLYAWQGKGIGGYGQGALRMREDLVIGARPEPQFPKAAPARRYPAAAPRTRGRGY